MDILILKKHAQILKECNKKSFRDISRTIGVDYNHVRKVCGFFRDYGLVTFEKQGRETVVSKTKRTTSIVKHIIAIENIM